MSYILKLASWYPSKVDAFNGDFVQRQAFSISLFEKIVVIYVVKSSTNINVTIEKKTSNNLTEYIGYYPKKKYFDKLFSQFYYFIVFKKIIVTLFKELGLPKLVHLNVVWKAGLWALYLKRKYKLPYIITEHWTGYSELDDNYIGNDKIVLKILKKIFSHTSYLLPVTKDLANNCIKLVDLNLNYSIIENAVNTSLFFPVVTNNEKIKIIHVSSMHLQKNLDGMLDVFEKIFSKNNNIELLLVGPINEKIHQKVTSNNVLVANITFSGNLMYEEVAIVLQKSDLLILFSKYENLPCVILESLCCGVPVISSNVGGINEVINNENGILVESENEIDLENGIYKMINNLSYYNKTNIAKDAMGKYSYDAIGSKFANAYKEILHLK
jgi:glycosyltransferase involved in cell wall biosynthesis